jgi:preprotein translocase subunit SecD
VADDVLASALGIGLAAERAKLEAWLAANPDAPVEVFNALDPAHEGPHAGLLWAATSFAGAAGPPQALLLPTQPEDHVGSGSFERTYLAQDAFGYPAIGFALQPERADDFARLTTAHVHHRLGIVLEGKLRSTPMLEASLIGGGVIEGRFTDEEVARLTESMEQHRGPLRVVEIR